MFPGINPNLAAQSIRPRSPGIPIINTITYTATQATVIFSPPDHNGGAAIRSFVIIGNPGNIVAISTGSTGGVVTFNSLVPGINYSFQIYAVNEISSSTVSQSSVIATPKTPPFVPGITSVLVNSSTQVTISYTAPLINGGSTITSFTAISSPSGITKSVATTASGNIVVTGLTTATSYTFSVYASNIIGDGPSTVTNSITTFAIAPDRPILGTAVATNSTTINIPYTAPGYNGGSIITSYTAISTPSSITITTSTSASGTFIFTRLTTATSYTFNVYATNVIGNSPSSTSNSVTTPSVVPFAPVIGIAVATSSTKATVAYTAPYNGGSTITSYTAISTPEGILSSTSTSQSGVITVVGLTTASNYTFRIYATNAIGTSTVSAASNQIKTFATPPNEPTIGAATYLGNRNVNIVYTAPAYNGGSTITSYTAISSPSGILATTSTSSSGNIVISVNALTTYTFRVYATNAVGTSTVSAASTSVVVPASVPAAPVITIATLTNATAATITYVASSDNGGAVITSYTAISTPGNFSATVNTAVSGNIVVTGLSSSTSYNFNVYAKNSLGNSPYSTNSNYVATWGSNRFYPASRATGPTLYTWIAPQGVTQISVVAIGAGGTGGASVLVNANATSYFCNTGVVSGTGQGAKITSGSSQWYPGGSYTGDGGGIGGRGGIWGGCFNRPAGGGGAAGYSGTGGYGASASYCGAAGGLPSCGSGGAAGGNNNYFGNPYQGGGGVGEYGRGATPIDNGSGGSGAGGSGGACAQATSSASLAGNFGGGGPSTGSGRPGGGGGGLGWKNNITVIPGNSYTIQVGNTTGQGGIGVVRVVWPATSPAGTRAFPSTNVSTP